MATKKVNIDIIAKDKTRMAMQGATRGINNLKNSVFNLKVAFAALGLGFVAKGFLNTSREIENLKVRFKFLFSTVEEGEKAFKGLLKFAGQVPFSLEEIQRGAASLAVVSDSAEEMNELLAITGDIAAASGLDFQTTAEQMMRVWSAGIASADLFRERGVRDMLEFEAGVRYSAEKSKEHILKAFREGTVGVKGASKEMATTFDGVMSMIGDKYLTFKTIVMDAAPYELIKAGFKELEKALEENFGTIEKAGQQFGRSLVDAFMIATISLSKLKDVIEPVAKMAWNSIKNLVVAVNELPATVKSLGLLGFLMLGTKGKLVVLAIGAVVDDLEDKVATMVEKFAGFNQKILEWRKKWDPFIDQEEIDLIQSWNDEMFEMVKNMRETVDGSKELNSEIENVVLSLGKWGDISEAEFNKMSKDTQALILFWKKLKDQIAETKVSTNIPDAITGGDEKQEKTLTFMQKLKNIVDEMTEGFSTGFNEAMKEAGNLMKNMEKVGKESFARLKETLTNFVMTGKLQFEDLARFIVRSIVEALVGKAVSAAITKSMQMFKMDAIKKAMISVYEGALKTFSSIPWPFNMIAVAGAIASGMALVNKIKGFEKGGRPPKNQPSIVGEKGPELFVPDTAGTIVPNNQLGGNPVTVNFNINTVDARGFNELLVNSRGVIVNMINSAVNEKGKVAII